MRINTRNQKVKMNTDKNNNLTITENNQTIWSEKLKSALIMQIHTADTVAEFRAYNPKHLREFARLYKGKEARFTIVSGDSNLKVSGYWQA
jgi:hypothetical protein